MHRFESVFIWLDAWVRGGDRNAARHLRLLTPPRIVKPAPEKLPVPLHEDRTFRAVIMVSSALGLGGVISSLTLLSRGPHGFEFHWTNLAIPAFVLGVVISCGYWWIVFRLSRPTTAGRRNYRFLVAASCVMIALALGAFLYPIRFIPPQKRTDVIIGLAIAVLVLGTIGYLIHTIVRWLEQETEEKRPEDPADEG